MFDASTKDGFVQCLAANSDIDAIISGEVE